MFTPTGRGDTRLRQCFGGQADACLGAVAEGEGGCLSGPSR